MNTIIWKYDLEVTDYQKFEIPKLAQILTVQVQDGKVRIWCLVDPEEGLTFREFRTAGTGHPIKEQGWVYLGTYQLNGGNFIGHVFYR